MSQPEQPRKPQSMGTGDVYPAAGHPVARSERDSALGRSDIRDREGLVVTETGEPGQRVVTSITGGQVVAQFVAPWPAEGGQPKDKVTIGEALEAAALATGDKPVGRADAAAVQAAEVRATGLGGSLPGGVAAAAQSAAEANERIGDGERRAKLGDVLYDAAARLPADKAATREDAARVREAEERNYGRGGEEVKDAEAEGGVAAAVMAASRINEERNA